MSGFEILIPLFAAGLALGLLYFRALWMTVCRLTESPRPVRLLMVSFAVRLMLLVLCLYFIMDGYAERLCAAVAGFIVAREICKRLWGTKREQRHLPAEGKSCF
ncbi:MAG: N-ATPase, AtpR subunit [Smithella sp. PtaU1.Bin162]|nr:MAG: N-ATPase, AtpR subunit [Smithella sp. PtaU1.Bin162]